MKRASVDLVNAAIDDERAYQDRKWDGVPLPPSDEMRLVRVILADSDKAWYATEDYVVDGTKVNPADLDAMRKIAAVARRCLENWGVVPRSKP